MRCQRLNILQCRVAGWGHGLVQSLGVNLVFGLPRWCSGKESACQCSRCKRLRFDCWFGKVPWRRKWQSTPVFLPGKFHGQRRLAGNSPWARKETDMTEQQNTHTQLAFQGTIASSVVTTTQSVDGFLSCTHSLCTSPLYPRIYHEIFGQMLCQHPIIP